EYQLGIQPKLQQQAKQLVDAGADLILGGHPHVVEPFEIYQGKLIAYSLGNFIFDQYFSADTQQGLMLKLALTASTVTVNVIPLVSSKSQIAVADGAVKAKMLERIAKDSVVSSTIRDGIRQGTFSVTK
ncbi:MAG: CapA family protein, partial [Patescibacteria group bacterium]